MLIGLESDIWINGIWAQDKACPHQRELFSINRIELIQEKLTQHQCLNLTVNGVAERARTVDNWNHNPGLYQLSYSHH